VLRLLLLFRFLVFPPPLNNPLNLSDKEGEEDEEEEDDENNLVKKLGSPDDCLLEENNLSKNPGFFGGATCACAGPGTPGLGAPGGTPCVACVMGGGSNHLPSCGCCSCCACGCGCGCGCVCCSVP